MVRKLACPVSEREHWISAGGGLLGILAVALSIAAMYSLRCLHPSGGATHSVGIAVRACLPMRPKAA